MSDQPSLVSQAFQTLAKSGVNGHPEFWFGEDIEHIKRLSILTIF